MKRLLLILAGLTVLCTHQIVYAQNVDYVSSALWSEVNDLEVSGNYAYCAFFNGLVVLDITDPAAPVLFEQEFLPGRGYGIDVDGNYAYIADGVSGLQIVDISDPANPEFVGECQTPGEARDIFVTGGYAYIADADSGLQIIDISDPSNPGLVGAGETSGDAVRIFVSGDYAYIADGIHSYPEGQFGLEIFDVSDPSGPALTGSYESEYQANDVWISGDYAFLGTGSCPWGCYGDMEVIDISNPYDPVLVGTSLVNEGVFRFFALDNYLFIGHTGVGQGGVLLLDISDPNDPIFIYDYTSADLYRLNALFAVEDYAIVAWSSWYYRRPDQYIETIDISDINNPIQSGTFPLPHRAQSVFVSDNYAFVAGDREGLQIVDISDPAAPSVVGRFETEGFASYVYVSGNFAYVISWDCGVGCGYWCDIVDISEVTSPTLVSSFTSYCADYENWLGDLFVSGDYAYIICTSRFILIWDVSDPYNPSPVNSFWNSNETYGIDKVNEYLYISGSEEGLAIYNVADPANEFLVGNCETPGQGRDVFCFGDYAYIADGSAGLQVIDISQPENPHIAGTFPTLDTARSVFVSGNYAYLADWHSGLQVVDVSDPSEPTFAGSYDTPGLARDIFLSDDYAYLTDYYNLMVLRFNPQTGIEEAEDLPQHLALSQNYPNPFNADTRIEFDIPALNDIDFAVYDILGRRVATLFHGQKEPGLHSLVWEAKENPSGVYFARVHSKSRTEVIRMTLLK